MSLTLVTKPTVYPVTLAEVKANSVIEHDDDDALLMTFIAAATDYAEAHTNRDLVQRTWDYSFDEFPAEHIELPKFPVQSVTSVTYNDVSQSPNQQTLSTNVYGLDSGGHVAMLYLKYNQYWPSFTPMHNGITVRFVSGYAGLGSPQDLRGNIPEAIKGAIRLIVGDLYEHRESRLDMQSYKNETADMLLNAYRLYHR